MANTGVHQKDDLDEEVLQLAMLGPTKTAGGRPPFFKSHVSTDMEHSSKLTILFTVSAYQEKFRHLTFQYPTHLQQFQQFCHKKLSKLYVHHFRLLASTLPAADFEEMSDAASLCTCLYTLSQAVVDTCGYSPPTHTFQSSIRSGQRERKCCCKR